MINCPYLEPKQSFFYSLSYLSILRQESWSYDYSQSYAPPTIGIKWERKLKYFLSGHYIKIETRMILSPKKNWTGYSSVLYYAVSELEWVETDYRFRNGNPPTGVLVSIIFNRNFIAMATTHKESTLILDGRPRTLRKCETTDRQKMMAGDEGMQSGAYSFFLPPEIKHIRTTASTFEGVRKSIWVLKIFCLQTWP